MQKEQREMDHEEMDERLRRAEALLLEKKQWEIEMEREAMDKYLLEEKALLLEQMEQEVMDKNMQRMEVLLSDSNSPGFQLMEWLEVIYFAILLAGGLALVLFHDFPGWECYGLFRLLWVFIIGPGLGFSINYRRLQSPWICERLGDPYAPKVRKGKGRKSL